MNVKLFLTRTLLVLGLCAWVALGRGEDKKDKVIPAPEFTGITEWVNAKEIKVADQKGKVMIVHFWTNGCINCIHNYPHYVAWQDKYKDEKSLVMVGVHTPEFDAEKDVARIKERAKKNKLTFAIAVDNDLKTWQAWGNRYWPCVYLVDKAGNVRYRWEGELGDAGYKSMTAQVDELLKEAAPKGK
ncbi:redoxin domain-containing protein [Limnoglobus roseus]|uniref:Thioredoxin n=1 Tax=Limnoglobus roseus TaxID=2598579 RepID=A0A5C1AS26_9BACT|nr:redoxin domain-containing protein [Limnoglobus roseus]QEL20836.1 thioredoxin [Limnoglobus roseus]